ncbi:hypothetical protein [Corynebacterium spheniscorum]|uniref:Uncharacterized protein n=1 Tax=Corynebacterium spheniscorum TaxID=185761 RepID=A0A1I2V0N8_9CORY|nr:hypothetical protein [Corynebacterium spheniscorum]SFG82710.1 hypothetical protein SAMN05660282_02075 [Corynebacterium spheniscorum]
MQQFITDLVTLAIQYFDGLFGLGLKGAIAGNVRTEDAFAELENVLSSAIHGGYAK